MGKTINNLPPPEILRRYFRVDSEWRVERRTARHGWKRVSKIRAGHRYFTVCFEGKCYPAHRLIWALHYGEQPPEIIDHINNLPWDNRIENLRAATAAQNRWNVVECVKNSTGFSGVKRCGTGYFAHVTSRSKVFRSPAFKDPELAGLAASELRRKLRGKFMPAEV